MEAVAQPVKAKSVKGKRPILLTILCVLGFIGLAFSFLSLISLILLSDSLSQASSLFSQFTPPLWYNVFSLVLLIPLLAGYIYIWKMRKLGLYIYTTTLIIGNIVAFVAGYGSLFVLPFSILFLILFWINFKKMS
tara:strand:+ start:3060 stop:3464 length:405 start_codon:yes stop_codon:yes gene_type:complete